jgi:glycosyltransferase involved in cell wall biosynthesis
MVVIEALASGAMVVGSDIPAIHELVVHGENGLLIKDFENPAAIADMVRVACTDHRVRSRSKANARRSVERFERSRIDALEAAHYQRVLELRAAGAFAMPIGRRIQSMGRRARRALPGPVKKAVRRVIGR